VAFGEAGAGFVADEFAVIILGRCRPEGAIEEQLPKGGAKEVGSSYDFGYSQLNIIDDAGELIAGEVVFSPHKEVAKVASDLRGLWPKCAVNKAERFTVGRAKPPICSDYCAKRRERFMGRRSKLGRIQGLGVLLRVFDSFI